MGSPKSFAVELPPAQHFTHTAQQISCRIRLQHVPVAAGGLQQFFQTTIRMGGKDKNLWRTTKFTDAVSSSQAAGVGHNEIQNDEIGMQGLGFVNGVNAVGSLAADFQIGLVVK